MERDDPRRCPQCGERGKRYNRHARYDGFGIRIGYRCPTCGTEWDTKLRRAGKARNPLDTFQSTRPCGARRITEQTVSELVPVVKPCTRRCRRGAIRERLKTI